MMQRRVKTSDDEGRRRLDIDATAVVAVVEACNLDGRIMLCLQGQVNKIENALGEMACVDSHQITYYFVQQYRLNWEKEAINNLIEKAYVKLQFMS